MRPARTGLLLAGLVLLEVGATAFWDGILARTWGGSEIAALSWTGGVRIAGLALVLLAARRGWIPSLRWHPAGLSTALRRGAGVALGFGALAFAGEAVLRARGGSLFLGILLGGAADPVYADPRVVAVHAAVGVLLGPLVEEAVFRGVLLSWLRERLPAVLSILLSALLFAGCHALSAGIGARGLRLAALPFLGGLAFAWLALGKGGLLGAWLLHAAGNAFLLFLQAWYSRGGA